MKKKWLIAGSFLGVSSLLALIFFSRKNRIVRRASFYEDIDEIGNNAAFADEKFEEMMKTAGWKSGEEWCMYFAKAVYLKALPLQKDKINMLSGSTQSSFNKVKNGEIPDFKVVTSGMPRRGDIVIWQNKDNPSKGHAGIVTRTTSWEYPLGFTTIEGNVSVNADFYGDGQSVRKAEHNLDYGQTSKTYPSKILRGFIRYAPLG